MSEVKPESTEAGQNNVTSISGLTAQVMSDPRALSLIQDRLAGMAGSLSGYYDTLPAPVKRRVKALKKLQVEILSIEAEMYRETHAVECRYASRYDSLFKKRDEIVNASYEPNDDECDFPSDVEDEDGEVKPKVEAPKNGSNEPSPDGIPLFWLTIFKNVELINENLQEHDEPILEHLKDIQVKTHESPMGFTLEFHFSENKFFSNSVLTKYYEMRSVVDEKDPFTFEGPEIVKCKGCVINWNKGENVTIKMVSKKQKHKSKGSVRTVQKEVQADSFFNFFSPPEIIEGQEPDEETEEILAADFEIGEIIRQRLVPRAVLYFTGEALEDDEDYEDEDEEDEEDDESESDSDEEEAAKGKKKSPAAIKGKPGKDGKNPEECKQQ